MDTDTNTGERTSSSRFSFFRNDWDAPEFQLIAHKALLQAGDFGQVRRAIAWIRDHHLDHEHALREIRGVRNCLVPYQRARVDIAVDDLFGIGSRGDESSWGTHPTEDEIRESFRESAESVTRKLRLGGYDNRTRNNRHVTVAG